MTADLTTLFIRLNPSRDDDDADLEKLSLDLAAELRKLDVERVDLAPPEAEAPPGTRGDPVTVGALVVALVAANGVLTTLITVVANAIKARSDRSVTLEIDGKKLILTNIDEDHQRRYAREWLDRLS